jgi:hypothetical protein
VADPASLNIRDLTFLYNDPGFNEYDAQLIAPRAKPPVIPSQILRGATSGVFLAQDVFNRGTSDGQERPQRGVQPIDRIAVIAARPTVRGESNDFSANEFEKRALIGFAPVYPDGSFKIEVPCDTPISFATLDEYERGIVTKRTHIYVRPGEQFVKCVGCHEDRAADGPEVTNPNPLAAAQPATNLNLTPDQWTVINYRDDIGPIVQAKCASCHYTKYFDRTTVDLSTGVPVSVTVTDSIPAPANLDLSDILETPRMGMGTFPRGYLNLSGEPMDGVPNVVDPAFPRRSVLVDAVLGLDSRAGAMHPDPATPEALTDAEKRLFNLWVLLGAQYR